MCVICDGGSEEDLLASEFMHIAVDGYTVMYVESDAPWCYTIGLLQSFDQPELAITGMPADRVNHVMGVLLHRIRHGDRFSSSSPPLELCECTTVAFGPVHEGQWRAGRFDQWIRYYEWAGGEPSTRDAIQVLWPNSIGEFPTGPDFCDVHGGSCQPLLDGAPRHNVNTGSRQQRRRARYGHGKRRR